MHSESRHEAAPASGTAVDDVLYTLFRHKWLILTFVVLGIAAAGVVRLLKPPLYQSEAKISVKYVMQTTGVNPAGPETQVTTPGFSGQEVMDLEVELIKSLDTALIVATNIGPEKILAEKGGGNHPIVAAAVVREGLNVQPPRSATISVIFKHPDETVVQPVLDAVIKAYMRRHLEARTGRGMEEVFASQLEDGKQKIAELDVAVKNLKLQAGVPNVEETKKAYQKHIAKLQDDLFEAESQLAQQEAIYGEWLADSTNTTALVVPVEVANEYREMSKHLDDLKKQVRRLLDDVTEFHPEVIKRNDKIAELTERMAMLEKQYPSLATLGLSLGASRAGTNDATLSIAASLADIKLLKRSVEGISNQLAMVKTQAFRLDDFDRQITELERQRAVEQKSIDGIQGLLDQARQADSKTPGRVLGMYLTQSPTPAGPDMKKLIKLVGMAFGGSVGLGIGIAFLIDMVLDRTIRRRQDVTRHLRLPVFLTIPDTNWRNRIHFPWLLTNGHAKVSPHDEMREEPQKAPPTMAVAEWNPTNHLLSHVEGLRERLITHFEVHNVNHKPKLVGVTSCDHGAGVTTLASGLAAALSKTGDGTALLVDMNTADGRTHSFYRGKPGCGPTEMPDESEEAEAALNPNLSLTSVQDQRKHDRLARLLPPSFNHLVPKLKATEYDYIVFDMPRVSPRSVTPRLSGQMDIVLMVIESERTGQQRASRSMALMREARATVVAVLNKCRDYVPARLAND